MLQKSLIMPCCGLPVLSGSLNPIKLRGSVLNLIELHHFLFVLGSMEAKLQCKNLLQTQARALHPRQWHQMLQLSYDAIEKLQRVGEEYLEAEGFSFVV